MKSARTVDLSPSRGSLVRIVDWSHRLLAEVLAPGDLAVDLTAGRGRDTLFLCRQVGVTGRVLAFDVQESALRATAALLQEAGADVRSHGPEAAPEFPPGVHLIQCCHSLFYRYLPHSPRAVVANLGYLPGGDPAIATGAASTRTALLQAFDILSPGGRLAVTVYTGHAGGREEGDAVSALFASLPPANWQVIRLQVENRPASPFLLCAERR